jgi:hypothetical protein
MTHEQVKLFNTKTPTHYRDLNRGLLFRSLDLRSLYQLAVNCEYIPESSSSFSYPYPTKWGREYIPE